MSESLLIIDDDKRLRELLEGYLLEKKFKVYLADDFLSAKDIISYFDFNLIIVDRMMPTGDGLNLIEIIKKKNNIPIIVLTAMGESNNKIEGLKYGADDYIAKPFEPEELYLRIKKLLKLYNQNNDQDRIITFGNFNYNLSTSQLKKDNQNIYLTEGENKLLNKLINKRNEIVLREELAESDIDENELRKIDVQITRLRQKIENNPKSPKYLQTIRGSGYVLWLD